jgi:hypothetical protein
LRIVGSEAMPSAANSTRLPRMTNGNAIKLHQHDHEQKPKEKRNQPKNITHSNTHRLRLPYTLGRMGRTHHQSPNKETAALAAKPTAAVKGTTGR